ncbi:MAG: zinc ribbon domain-containing protein [Actinobacteria bacterium]|nr:zinc ribbon domain-containing protein [Actinomycetota bacterium]
MSNIQGSPSGMPQGIGMKQYPASPISSDGLIAGFSIVYFIVLFLPWTKSAFSISNGSSSISFSVPFSMNGWGGAGVAAGVFAFLLFIWAGIRLARIAMPMPNNYRSLVAAVLGGLVFLFGLLRIITNLSLLTSHMSAVLYVYGLFAWLGLLLAIGVLYAAWGEWREWQFAQISKAPGSYPVATAPGMFQGAPQPNYPQPNYPQPGYPQQGYPPQPQDAPQPNYPQPGYSQPDYPPPQSSSSPTLQEVNPQGMSQPQAPYQGGVVPPQESEQPSSSGQLQCAHCGSLNLSGTSFCTSCGAPLA